MLPLTYKRLEEIITKSGIQKITTATIRQIVALAKALEQESEEKFIHLELGNPGLIAERIGIEAECEALQNGIANTYPEISGIPEIKIAGSQFIKSFLNIDIRPQYIIPTVGSMQASYTLMTLLKQRIEGKDALLIFNPGFPAQTHQAKMLGMDCRNFDIYDYRGEKLREKLDQMLGDGKVTAMIYSNPNNPSWSNFTEQELQIIGEAANKYDVIVIEDLAYMGMDYRKDFSIPGKSPFIPSVAKYTNNYILMISASKIFSYAGQRVAIVAMSPDVFERKYPVLDSFYEMPNFGECYIYGVLYTASSGVAHSAQYGMAAMMKKAVEGELPFIEHTKEYAKRASRLKNLFLSNGFHIVYEKDGLENISDGFFFTIGYPNLSSEKLQKELLRYGVATISLTCTGSTKDGVRICVSMMNNDSLFNTLNSRLKKFNGDHV